MGWEIERKFLVKSSEYKNLAVPILFRQGYLSTNKESTVRIRTEGKKAYITIKGKIINLKRLEFQYEIPFAEAEEMMNKLCNKALIEKYRYKIMYKNKLWEIDKYLGYNKGLVIAEIELKTANEQFEKPQWIGKDVSSEMKYSNSNLYKFPYKSW